MSSTGPLVFDMKNHRLSSAPSALFCVVIGRACRWPLPWRVVNIANLMSLIMCQSLSRVASGAFISVTLIDSGRYGPFGFDCSTGRTKARSGSGPTGL